MSLTIGVRFIESGKSKRAMIISEIRGRNAYPSGTTKFRTNRNAGDRTGDKSSGEAVDVEESSISSG